jgi:hypothetical protein
MVGLKCSVLLLDFLLNYFAGSLLWFKHYGNSNGAGRSINAVSEKDLVSDRTEPSLKTNNVYLEKVFDEVKENALTRAVVILVSGERMKGRRTLGVRYTCPEGIERDFNSGFNRFNRKRSVSP